MREIQQQFTGAVKTVEGVVDIANRDIKKRFPALFTLIVSFGLAATFFGMERIIAEVDWLNARPWLIFLVGVLILAGTGRLYKKLG